MTLKQQFGKFISGKCFGLRKQFVDFFVIGNNFRIGNINDFIQIFRHGIFIHPEKFSFFFVSCYKKACTCPSGIVSSLIVVFLSDFYIFSFAFNYNKSGFLFLLVLFGFPNNKICSGFTLPAM